MTVVDRLDGINSGLAIKAPVRVATTANITLSGLQTIDGVTVAVGDRVLVNNQTTGSENGIYNVAASAWTRAKDFDGPRDVVQGTCVVVTSGSTFSETFWKVSTANPQIGSALAFSRITSDAQAASEFADLAEAWASQPEDEDVDGAGPGDRSALHWAAKAEAHKNAAQTAETNAEASALAAAGSEAGVAASAAAALTSENNAAASETASALSETNAAASESAAALSELAAAASANTASTAADDATAAALLATIAGQFNTKALADAGVGSYSAGQRVLVWQDETLNGQRVVYEKVSSAWANPQIIPPGVMYDSLGDRQIAPSLTGLRSFGLRLRKAISDVRAGTKKDFTILVIGDSLATVSWTNFHMQIQHVLVSYLQSTPVYSYGQVISGDLQTTDSYTAALSSAQRLYTGTFNQKVDYDMSFIGTNMELTSGQYCTFSIGGNNVRCDRIYIPLVREPGAGAVKILLSNQSTPQAAAHASWVDVTAPQIVSSHSLTGSELIVDCNGTFGCEVVELSVSLGAWGVQVVHSSGGAVRMINEVPQLVKTAAAINTARISIASNDFTNATTTSDPVMAQFIAALNPDMIIVASDDRLTAYQNLLPKLEQAITSSGLSHPPLVVIDGNFGYSNPPFFNDATFVARNQYCKDFVASRMGWDFFDGMAFSGGIPELTKAGWNSDGIHIAGEVARQATIAWARSRGIIDFMHVRPGGDAALQDFARISSNRFLRADRLVAALIGSTSWDTSVWTWAYINTGTASGSKSSVSSYLNLATGATAASNGVAYLNEAITPLAHNQVNASNTYVSGFSTQVRITVQNATGICRILWSNRTYNGAHGGALAALGVGWQIEDNVIKGITWKTSAQEITTASKTLVSGATARSYQLMIVLQPYQVLAGTYNASLGVANFFVNGVLLERLEYTMGNINTPRFEIENGATAANYAVSVVPPKCLEVFPEF